MCWSCGDSKNRGEPTADVWATGGCGSRLGAANGVKSWFYLT
ncbi:MULTISPECIES: hypothetical protein [unclassified Nostoc]|nr:MULTISPECIES: hypothetical protein [unclassified Nostoc]